MYFTREEQIAREQVETTRNANVPTAAAELANEYEPGVVARALSVSPAEPNGNGTAKLFRSPSFVSSSNSRVRVIALSSAQATHGNRYTQRLITQTQLNAKNSQLMQRECACGGTCAKCSEPSRLNIQLAESRLLQRQPFGGSHASSVGSPGGEASASDGQPLGGPTRRFMEQHFGADFGDVRVHTDQRAAVSAEALEANAFTSGRDIYFAQGKYQPDSFEGRRLLAHELTHTLQQSQGRSGVGTSLSNGQDVVVTAADDPLEQEAGRAANELYSTPTFNNHRNKRASGLINRSAATIQRQPTENDRIAELRRYLDDDDERAALDLMVQLSSSEVARVLSDDSLRGLAVSAFNDGEMVAAIRNMGGRAVPSLRWLFAEGVDYGDFRDWLAGPPAGMDEILLSDEMRSGFVSACDDEQMAEVVKNLPGPLPRKMEWLRAEDTGYRPARTVIDAAPSSERPTLYERDDLRDWFVDICDDIWMQNLVLDLGGTLIQKLNWMRAEGSNWTLLRVVLTQGIPAAERSQVLDDAGMRTFFQETLSDDEMKEAVDLLGGELSQKMEWMHAEGADVAPAGVRDLPRIAPRDRELMETLDRRSDLFARFKELEDAEAAYDAQTAHSDKIPEDAFKRVNDARNALNASLKAEGYSGIEAFLDEMRRFEAFFHGFALQTAFAMLDENRHLAEQEKSRYEASGELDEAWKALEPLRQHLPAIREKEADLQKAIDIENQNPRDLPFESLIVREAREALAAEKKSAIDAVRPAFGRFPVLANTDLHEQIFNVAQDRAALATLFRNTSVNTMEKIDTVARDLTADTSKLWQMDPVIDRAKAALGIVQGSAMDGIIRRKLAQVKSDATWKALVIGALALGLGLLSGGAGAVAVLAAAGALGLSAWGAYEHYEEFQFQTAARGSALDPTQALSQIEPSVVWLAVDILGVFLDLHGLVTAMRGMSGPARALAAAKTAEEAQQQTTALRAAAREASGQVSSTLRQGASLENAVVRSAERVAARKATLASNAELVESIRKAAPQLAEDEAALAGLARMGREGSDQAIRSFRDNPELLKRLAHLAEADPAVARGAASLQSVVGESAAPMLRDVLLRSDPSRARSLLAAVSDGRLTSEQLNRIAQAARSADEAGRARAIAEAIDKELTAATGIPAPGSQAEREALAASAKLDGAAITDPVTQLQTEWRYVERTTPTPIREGEYIAEVSLPNGHRWRQHKNGNWCRFSGEFCIPKNVMRDLEQAGGAVTGRVTRAEFGVTTQAPIDWPIVRIDPKHPPDVVPPGVVLEFPTGERVWRTLGEDGGIVIESKLGAGVSRKDFEAAYFSRKEMEVPGYVKSDLERAHSQGAGTGFEAPFAIPYAPREVNQTLQNLGIEEYLRLLRDNQPEGVVFGLMTNTRVHPDTRRLSLIEYTVTATYKGERRTLFNTGIRVEGTLEQPVVTIAGDLTSVHPQALESLPLDDLAESMLQRRLDMIARRARGAR